MQFYELLIYGLKSVVAKAATAATVPTPLSMCKVINLYYVGRGVIAIIHVCLSAFFAFLSVPEKVMQQY